MQQQPPQTENHEDHDLVPDEGQPGSKQRSEQSLKEEKEIEPREEIEEPLPPQKQDWTPLDLSHGTIKKGIFGPRRGFKTHVRQDLKKDLGTILSAKQRGGVAEEFAKLRAHGLSRGEVRGALKKMVEEGKLTKFEAKKLRREFGATKSSSIF